LVTEIHYNNKVFSVDTDKGIDLSIRNDFSGRAPTFYGSEQPRYKALRSG